MVLSLNVYLRVGNTAPWLKMCNMRFNIKTSPQRGYNYTLQGLHTPYDCRHDQHIYAPVTVLHGVNPLIGNFEHIILISNEVLYQESRLRFDQTKHIVVVILQKRCT